jgi:hypothetical protein
VGPSTGERHIQLTPERLFCFPQAIGDAAILDHFGVAELGKMSDVETDFMPSPSLYVGETDQRRRAVTVDQEKFTDDAARFLGPRQLPIGIKDARATVMLTMKCKQVDRSNDQLINIIIKKSIDATGVAGCEGIIRSLRSLSIEREGH